MKPKISIITLAVSDIERSTSFYRDGLGLPTYGNFPGITFFELSGTWLALYPQDQLAVDAQVDGRGQKSRGIGAKTSQRHGLGRILGIFLRPRWIPLGSGMESSFRSDMRNINTQQASFTGFRKLGRCRARRGFNASRRSNEV